MGGKEGLGRLQSSMQLKIKVTPRLLHKSAGHSSCCIFRVPQSLVEVNRKAYHPHIVSIGSYHHGNEHISKAD
ncbi:putative transmembrane protein [Thalictrum thalictroides]|uniref:Putative transmembrane protein n=1 Tax=Thalictrum thalictroides TaxID=46969 RepID=A0A7J6WWD4_THATH|nr:putative transmembrane protein [Thalictrum thalictroides]